MPDFKDANEFSQNFKNKNPLSKTASHEGKHRNMEKHIKEKQRNMESFIQDYDDQSKESQSIWDIGKKASVERRPKKEFEFTKTKPTKKEFEFTKKSAANYKKSMLNKGGPDDLPSSLDIFFGA